MSKKTKKNKDDAKPVKPSAGLWSERRLHASSRSQEAGTAAFESKLLVSDESTTHFFQKRDLLRFTTRAQFITGIVDIDMLAPFFDNAMIEISGDPNTGKSTTLFYLAGQAQRHCRHCRTLIVDWIHPETGETFTKCWCGVNEPCRVLVVVSENSFPAAYAARWGLDIGDITDKKIEKGDQPVAELSPTLTVAWPEDGEEALDICVRATQNGLVDFIGIESLAALLPRAHRESFMKADMKVGAHAKLVRTGLVKLATEMSGLAQRSGSGPLVVWTNHLTMDVNQRNPKADPRVTRGGTGAKYMKSTAIKIRSAGRDTVTFTLDDALSKGKRAGLRSLTPRFLVEKSRFGTEGTQGQYTLFMASGKAKYKVGSKGQFVPIRAGTIDSPSRLVGYLTRMGIITYKKSRGFRFKDAIFGLRTESLPDLIAHFARADVYLRGLLLTARLTLPELSVDAIHQEAFYYPPWADQSAGRADGAADEERRRKKKAKREQAALREIFNDE